MLVVPFQDSTKWMALNQRTLTYTLSIVSLLIIFIKYNWTTFWLVQFLHFDCCQLFFWNTFSHHYWGSETSTRTKQTSATTMVQASFQQWQFWMLSNDTTEENEEDYNLDSAMVASEGQLVRYAPWVSHSRRESQVSPTPMHDILGINMLEPWFDNGWVVSYAQFKDRLMKIPLQKDQHAPSATWRHYGVKSATKPNSGGYCRQFYRCLRECL